MPKTAEKRRRGGRPRLPASTRRSRSLTLRLSPLELEEITRHAESDGVQLRPWARGVLLGAHPRVPRVPRINLRAIGELGRLGNNLNQAVHLMHQGRAPRGFLPAVEKLTEYIGELRRCLEGDREAV